MSRSDAMAEAIIDETRFFTELIPVAGADSETGLNVMRAGRLLLDRTADYLRRAGMSEAQFNVLVVLESAPDGLVMCEVARRMLVSRAGMSGVVKGLEGKGWVSRHPVPGDARAWRLTATASGLAALEAVLPEHFSHVHWAMSCLSNTEKADLIRILTRLRGHLVAGRAAAGRR
ncbi:MAG: MarR family transcriptional regulator [Nitrospirae bacterium]|nr:MarR family transcriptional regulator [Nitrospirota bacterium]